MSRDIKGIGTDNARFRPVLKRKPRAVKSGIYHYCPTMLTKHPKLEQNQIVTIIKISDKKLDPTVTVCCYPCWGGSQDEYVVMWEDLRR
jgi:hypothetical protein